MIWLSCKIAFFLEGLWNILIPCLCGASTYLLYMVPLVLCFCCFSIGWAFLSLRYGRFFHVVFLGRAVYRYRGHELQQRIE